MRDGYNQNNPKYLIITNEIKDQIKNGAIKAGEPLPPIRVVAERYSSSISTIQRAYDQLENEGYLERVPGKETRVSPLMGRVGAPSTAWKVFWSYAHRDDELSDGRITQLKKDIQSEYELQTGENLDVFQDSDGIEWGVDWRKAIGDNLGITSFFVPVLTPTYLRRPQCLSELKNAYHRFSELGYEKGIYPIEFIDIGAALHRMDDDELANFLDNCQRFRDSSLRLEERTSADYKRAICKIVSVLISRDAELRNVQLTIEKKRTEIVESFEDDRGILDVVIDINNQCSELITNANCMAESISKIGCVFSSVQLGSTATPKQILAIVVQISRELAPLGKELRYQGGKYRTSIKQLDKSVATLVELCELTGNTEGAETTYKALTELRDKSSYSFSQVDILKEALSKAERLSRSLRQPCADIRAALEDFQSSEAYFAQWVDIVEPLAAS